MRCILATDGSAASIQAAEWLKVRLPEAETTELFLLYVFPLPADGHTYAHLVSLPQDAADPRVTEIAHPVLARTRAACGDVAARVHDVILVGNPAESIVRFAVEMRADLVVVGHRGRSLTSELYLGGVANAVVHRAHCPVLVVR